MGLFNSNEEKEVSTGATIGYLLIAFALFIIITFGIFVGYKKLFSEDTTLEQNTQIEQTVDVEIEDTTE